MNCSTLRLLATFLFFFLSFQISFAQNIGYCDCVTLGNCPTPIPDNGKISIAMPVSLPGTNDLSQCPLEKVCFTITHTWIGDLSVNLTSPSGLNYLVMGDVNNEYGGCGMPEDNVDICIVTGDFNPIVTKTNGALTEYICNPGPCPAGSCCLTGDYTVPCGGVTDPINGALQAPNCDLNAFNVPGHLVNGNWILTVQDVCNMDMGTLDNFSLSFACDTTVAASGCQANGGFLNVPDINVCEGDPLLALDIQPIFCFSSPVDTLFDYTFLVVENDVILVTGGQPDLTSYPAGDYLIYGFSFEKTAAAQLADLEGTSLQASQTTFNSSNAPYCGAFSIDFVSVKIYVDPINIDCQTIWVNAGEDVYDKCVPNHLIGSGSISVSSPCLTYYWKDMAGDILSVNEADIYVSNPGLYEFSIVWPGSSCTVADTVEIFPSQRPTVDFGVDTIYSCWGADILIGAVVTGSGDFRYSWRRPSSGNFNTGDSVIIADLPGVYILQLRDNSNYCYNYDTLTVAHRANLIEGTQFTQAGCDMSNGTATVLVDPTLPNLDYLWSTGEETSTIGGLSPGWYSVSVSDDDCQYEESIFVEEDLSCKVVIGGHVYNDHFDQDCMLGNTPLGVECIMLRLMPEGIYTYSKPDGSYEFIAYPGDHTVEYVDEDRYELLCPATGAFPSNLPDGGMSSTANDFFVKVENGQNLKISLTKSPAQRGFLQDYYLKYENLGSEPAAAVVNFTHDFLLQNYNLSTIADNYDQPSRTATWGIANIPPGVSQILHFSLRVPQYLTLGTPLAGAAKIEPINVDTYPYDNRIEWSEIVIGSYDPNEKSTHTGENQWGGKITENDTIVSYQILFQNTGTDTAFTVVIRDTLDENLDVETIRPGVVSHDYFLEFDGRNILVFNFKDILLPDSNINEPASHGYATFTIKRNKALLPNVEIKNKVAIYFDYNDPIITNETVHYIPTPIYTTYENVALCAGEPFQGNIYTENTVLVDTVHYGNVDSIFVTSLTIIEAVETNVEATMCMGSVFEIGGQVFTSGGNYILNLKTTLGCDSTVNLTLLENDNVSIQSNASICEGEAYYFYGDTLISAGNYSTVIPSTNAGCDTIAELDLEILQKDYYSFAMNICNGDEFVFGNESLTEEGIYTNIFTNSLGCDSTVTLQLTVSPDNVISYSEYICEGESYEFNGEVLTESGDYFVQYSNIYGCDSTVIFSLNVLPNSEYQFSELICEYDSLAFNGEWLSMSGIYTSQQVAANGCDSLVTLFLEVTPLIEVEEDTAVVIGGEIYGHVIYSDTVIVQEFLHENGCFYSLTTNVSVYVNSFEINENIHLQILPNPNDGQFILKGEMPIGGEYDVVIYNVFGQLLDKPFSNIYLHKHFVLDVDVERLTQGVYYLLLQGKENKIKLKFVVMN